MKHHRLEYDLAVVGAGPAGLAAAITAARMGRRVVLVERSGCLGGALALGISPLGMLDKKGRKIVSGFAEEFFGRLQARGDCLGTDACPKHNSVTGINAEGVKRLAIEMCREAGADILLHCEVLKAAVQGRRIDSVDVYGKGNIIHVKAEQYIDCTGDGDLAYLAGCSYEKGREDDGTLQPPTMVYTLQGVNQERLFDYVENHPEELRYHDRAIYENPDYTAEHFRMRPSHVFVGLQATFRRLKAEGRLPVERESLICINGTHSGEVYINATRLLRTDATDILALSRAVLDGTLQAFELTELLREHIPGFEHCYVSSVAPSLGIRETRRLKGIRYVTGQEAKAGLVPPDSICLSGYKIDIHSGTDTGLLFTDIEEPFGIPFGCLVSAEIDNLMMAGRCISCDETAYGSLRVIPCCLAMGQAAAVGAWVAAKYRTLPAEADIEEIRAILLGQNAILSMPGGEEEVREQSPTLG